MKSRRPSRPKPPPPPPPTTPLLLRVRIRGVAADLWTEAAAWLLECLWLMALMLTYSPRVPGLYAALQIRSQCNVVAVRAEGCLALFMLYHVAPASQLPQVHRGTKQTAQIHRERGREGGRGRERERERERGERGGRGGGRERDVLVSLETPFTILDSSVYFTVFFFLWITFWKQSKLSCKCRWLGDILVVLGLN